MAYQALYREWRPQSFADVVGQPHIVRTLQNMIRQGRIYHAFLFCGPRGTGKTTLAKLLAKALNCQQGPTAEPCLRCPACLGIKSGSYVDVLEIDGASNRGIDEIRDLRDRVKYSPAEGRYKVYIIDEVHMLTTEAFNALLKTLEEPPAHVVFVFATTEVQKVPATILSRCQRFDFRRISPKVIEQELTRLCQRAGIKAEPEALQLIASAANGGMRDALSMLDQTQSYAGEQAITAGDVQEVVGLVPDLLFGRLTVCLLRGEFGAALVLLDELTARGKEIVQIVDGFVQYARNCLLGLVKLAPEGFVPPSAEVSAGFLTKLLDALLSIERDLRFSSNQRVLLELAMFRTCQGLLPLGGQPTSAPVQSSAPVSPKLVAAAPVQPESSASDRHADEQLDVEPPPVEQMSGLGDEFDEDDYPEMIEDDVPMTAPIFKPSSSPLTLRLLRQRWPGFVSRLAAEDPSVGAPLASGQVIDFSASQVSLQFEKTFAMKVVVANRQLIERMLQAEFSLPLSLNCVLQAESPPKEADREKLTADDADQIALSLFDGQEIDSNQMGGPKDDE